jgi:hypothetical protein
MDTGEVDESAPRCVARAFDVPFLFYPAPHLRPKYRERRLVPVLVLQLDGKVFVPTEAFWWARSMVDLEQWSPAAIHQAVAVLGRLWEFWGHMELPELENASDAEALVFSFLYENVIETPDTSSISEGTLDIWFRALKDYAAFCRTFSGEKTVMGKIFSAASEIFRERAVRSTDHDFFEHLRVHRERLEIIRGGSPKLPKTIRKAITRPRKVSMRDENLLSTEMIDEMIKGEQNPTFKGILLALGGLGGRLSEPLNAWRSDVLPSGMLRYLASTDDGPDPLFVFPHPVKSTFCGSFATPELVRGKPITRRQFLFKQYSGLKPRSMSDEPGLRAGWKGMLPFTDTWVSWGFWIKPEWAQMFQELLPELDHLHWRAGTASKHPWLFINAVNDEYFGQPVKIKSFEQAFDVRLKRIDVDPAIKLMGPNVLRHHYRWRAKRVLGLDDDDVQIMMRHRKLQSQQAYGQRTADVHDNLKASLASITARTSNSR